MASFCYKTSGESDFATLPLIVKLNARHAGFWPEEFSGQALHAGLAASAAERV
jgi:hypothetical protein